MWWRWWLINGQGGGWVQSATINQTCLVCYSAQSCSWTGRASGGQAAAVSLWVRVIPLGFHWSTGVLVVEVEQNSSWCINIWFFCSKANISRTLDRVQGPAGEPLRPAGEPLRPGCKFPAPGSGGASVINTPPLFTPGSGRVLIRPLMIRHRVPMLLWPKSSRCGAFFSFCRVCVQALFLHFAGNVCYSVKGSFVSSSKCASVYLTHPGSINRRRRAELQVHLTQEPCFQHLSCACDAPNPRPGCSGCFQRRLEFKWKKKKKRASSVLGRREASPQTVQEVGLEVHQQVFGWTQQQITIQGANSASPAAALILRNELIAGAHQSWGSGQISALRCCDVLLTGCLWRQSCSNENFFF